MQGSLREQVNSTPGQLLKLPVARALLKSNRKPRTERLAGFFLASGAAMRELRSADEPVIRHVFVYDTTAAADSEKAIMEVTGTVSIALPPMRLPIQGTVHRPPSRTAERSIGQILALMAMVASGLLAVLGPDRAAVDHYLAVIGVALPIACYLWNKHHRLLSLEQAEVADAWRPDSARVHGLGRDAGAPLGIAALLLIRPSAATRSRTR